MLFTFIHVEFALSSLSSTQTVSFVAAPSKKEFFYCTVHILEAFAYLDTATQIQLCFACCSSEA
eukprot:m.382091 g.382091  ORF g.382091 m.382091 type:complete len:64 (-) comp114277_c0_seq1:22-213(-)